MSLRVYDVRLSPSRIDDNQRGVFQPFGNIKNFSASMTPGTISLNDIIIYIYIYICMCLREDKCLMYK